MMLRGVVVAIAALILVAAREKISLELTRRRFRRQLQEGTEAASPAVGD